MELKIGVDQDILSTLELTTRKEVNRTTMPGNLREKGARLVCESYIPSASASSVVVSSNAKCKFQTGFKNNSRINNKFFSLQKPGLQSHENCAQP